MNNEWNLDPDHDDRTGSDPAGATSASGERYPSDPTPASGAASGSTGAADNPFARPDSGTGSTDNTTENTSILPPARSSGAFIPPAATGSVATAPAPARRAGALSAAVIVGALVLGGAAGVGGAAAYDAINGSDTSNTSSNGDFQASSSGDSPASQVTGSISSVAAKVLPSVVQVNIVGDSASGTGSGIVLSSDGTILTNNHVATAVSGGTLSVRFNNGKVVPAKVVGTDPVTDLAVIRAQGVSDLTPAQIGKSSQLQIGQQVIAIGSPEGLTATVTSGIVSALNRAVSITSSGAQGDSSSDPFGLGQQQQSPGSTSSQTTTYPAIQTDASINEGNSGGPLVNMSGQVVGINSAIKTSGDSSGSIGIGFSIPMDEALPIVNQIRKGQTPTHARLGVSVSDNTASKTPEGGALVQDVTAGESGAAAGLKKGDVVTKVGDHLIEDSNDLVATVRGDRPGQKVDLKVLRDGKTIDLTATLGSDASSTTTS